MIFLPHMKCTSSRDKESTPYSVKRALLNPSTRDSSSSSCSVSDHLPCAEWFFHIVPFMTGDLCACDMTVPAV